MQTQAFVTMVTAGRTCWSDAAWSSSRCDIARFFFAAEQDVHVIGTVDVGKYGKSRHSHGALKNVDGQSDLLDGPPGRGGLWASTPNGVELCWFAACSGGLFHRLHLYGWERGIVAGPESTGHGCTVASVSAEDRHPCRCEPRSPWQASSWPARTPACRVGRRSRTREGR